MDKLNEYRRLVREKIQQHAQSKPSLGDVQVEVIFDESNDHYALVYAGWHRVYRIHGEVIHIDIRNGKIWIQHDGTPDSIAEELVKEGVPHEDIVLAYKHPDMRPHTDFAAA